jgi:hypothetical protein
LFPGVAEHFGLDPEPQILHRDFLQPVEFIRENDREFLGRISIVKLPLSHLAHGGQNVLVVTVSEPEATGPDLVFLQAGPCQRFDMVRLGNSGVQVSAVSKRILRIGAIPPAVFCAFMSSSRPNNQPAIRLVEAPA